MAARSAARIAFAGLQPSLTSIEAISEIRMSGNSSFWDEGYSALMITDTSFLRNRFEIGVLRGAPTPQ